MIRGAFRKIGTPFVFCGAGVSPTVCFAQLKAKNRRQDAGATKINRTPCKKCASNRGSGKCCPGKLCRANILPRGFRVDWPPKSSQFAKRLNLQG